MNDPLPPGVVRKPSWLRAALPRGAEFERVNARLRACGVNTVCSSARCPNLTECWNRGTATFLVLGPVCTRHCRFCAVATGNPGGAVDPTEPERVAAAVAALDLRYVVLTSVDRDDLPDLGAGMLAATVAAVRAAVPQPVAVETPGSLAPEAGQEAREKREGQLLPPEDSPRRNPGIRCREARRKAPGEKEKDISLRRIPRAGARGHAVLCELLAPDFGAREELIGKVLAAGPAVFGHNLETVARLTPQVRDRRSGYRRSLAALETAKRLAPGSPTKSGLMVGLGETDAEVSSALRDLRAAGCDIVTIGQYLRPARRCLPVARYPAPERFAAWTEEALSLGFRAAHCGPLVRSSYLADRLAPAATR